MLSTTLRSLCAEPAGVCDAQTRRRRPAWLHIRGRFVDRRKRARPDLGAL